MKILVLGGTGLVGREFLSALRALWSENSSSENLEVVVLSRRGSASDSGAEHITVRAVQCDATDDAALRAILAKEAPLDAIVHCMGALFDGQSGLGRLNLVVSAAKSLPDKGSSYEEITRQSAVTCMESLVETHARLSTQVPFCLSPKQHPKFLFVSAAEAGWADTGAGRFIEKHCAPAWLKRYLAAKRAVEQRAREISGKCVMHIFRPSFIWSPGKVDVLPPTLLFYCMHFASRAFDGAGLDKKKSPCGICGSGIQRFGELLRSFERPVRKETVGRAIAAALLRDDGSGGGIQVHRFGGMDALEMEYMGKLKGVGG